MIAIDTNLLVYAHRPEFPWHHAAQTCLRQMAEGAPTWGIPHHALVEFAATVTHPRKFRQPSTPEQTVDQILAWRESPSLLLLQDGPESLSLWLELITTRRISGTMQHDARIAAVCLVNGVTELWTADRDYQRFPELRVRNPLIMAGSS